jgi:FkbM family methyltransferase
MKILERFENIISGTTNPVVFECGACDGYHSEIMINILTKYHQDNWRFWAFEPVPNLVEIIRNRISYGPPKFNLVPAAVGSSSGRAIFHISSGTKYDSSGKPVDHYYGSSSLRMATEANHESWPDMKFSDAEVSVISLDDCFESNGLTKIDFMWVDIQGCQRDLIAGGHNALSHVRYMYTEKHEGDPLYEGATERLTDLLELLPGWEVVEDYPGDVLLKNTQFEELS